MHVYILTLSLSMLNCKSKPYLNLIFHKLRGIHNLLQEDKHYIIGSFLAQGMFFAIMHLMLFLLMNLAEFFVLMYARFIGRCTCRLHVPSPISISLSSDYLNSAF